MAHIVMAHIFMAYVVMAKCATAPGVDMCTVVCVDMYGYVSIYM